MTIWKDLQSPMTHSAVRLLWERDGDAELQIWNEVTWKRNHSRHGKVTSFWYKRATMITVLSTNLQIFPCPCDQDSKICSQLGFLAIHLYTMTPESVFYMWEEGTLPFCMESAFTSWSTVLYDRMEFWPFHSQG